MFATQSAGKCRASLGQQRMANILVGILGISNYQVVIYGTLGLEGQMPLVMYVVFAIVGTIPNYLGSYYMDKIGRRTMLRT